MPIYTYQCKSCGEQFDKFHSMLDLLTNCDLCGAKDSLEKQLTELTSYKKEENGPKVGDLVTKHIEETRRELKKDKALATREIE